MLLVFLSVLVFFAGDNLLFRTALYTRFLPRITKEAKVAQFARVERGRDPSGRKEVLVTGNSRMEYGFWDGLANSNDGSGQIRFIQAATGGSSEKWWYYILKYVDPNHDRYSAIVISTADYTITPFWDDFENDPETAEVLTPLLSWNDWPAFIGSFTDENVRERAKYQAIFTSHSAGIGMLVNSTRILQRFAGGGERKILTDAGPPENVDQLQLTADLSTVTAYPSHFDSFRRHETNLYLNRPSADAARALTARNLLFHSYWAGKILEEYRGSPTRIIFVQMPRSPLPLPAIEAIPGAPQLQANLPRQSNVTFLDPEEFTSLERPQYFYDILHMNAAGRRQFTLGLADRVKALIAPQTSAAPVSASASKSTGSASR